MKKSDVIARKDIITVSDFEKLTGIHFTVKHTGKMKGMQSLSSSCLLNPACLARIADPDSVCAHCYAAAMHKRYSAMSEALKRNTEALTRKVYDMDMLPLINAAFFRFESFGDIANVIQARNYLRIAKKNPHTRFALWTKNPGFLASAIKEEGKPENLSVILSSPYMNTPCDASRWEFVDKTFTVWTKDAIAEQGVQINCGSRKCLDCLLCYTKNDVHEINEVLK